MLGTFRKIGPGALVAAAFVGPGTVTACTLAGAGYGYALLWALVFAAIATMVLQEMTARLGLVTGQGLGALLRARADHPVLKVMMISLVGTALYAGNAAYEAGNLAGAALGIEAMFGNGASGRLVFSVAIIGVASVAAALLVSGRYRLIERILIGLVMVMGLAFLVSFVVIRPNLGGVVRGLFTPTIPTGSLLTVIALIGTTIVPYNLFLHAAAVKARFGTADHLGDARADTVLSVGFGGIITILILATAAASFFSTAGTITNAADMATALEPALGPLAKYVLGMGLLAAGLSSAITAPLATSYAITETLRLRTSPNGLAFRLIFLSVLIVGAGLALLNIKPLTIILFAQFANGLLLPLVAIALLVVMNDRKTLGTHTNGPLANVAGLIVVTVSLGLGLRLILKALGAL
ncbi:MAG: Nramp family divalent metal transporter [Pseudomonadota bacterium]